jgi:hypothetical protein
VRVFDLADDEDAVQASDAVDVAQGVEHELLVSLHVACKDLDLEIEVAAGVVELGNLLMPCTVSIKLLNELVGVLL